MERRTAALVVTGIIIVSVVGVVLIANPVNNSYELDWSGAKESLGVRITKM